MTYQAYVHRIKRIAVVFDAVRKRKVPILAALAFLILLTSTFLFVNGMLVGAPSCEQNIVYGQTLSCNSFVLFGDATYEYTEAGSENWTEEMPRMPGEYLMRAVTVRTFGITDYSEPVPFTIDKYTAEISAAGDQIPYGQKPEADIHLIKGDKIDCIDYEFDDYSLNPTDVRPIANSIRIVNQNGDDVTQAYDLKIIPKNIQIVPRPVTIRIEGAEKIYDGTPLTNTQWEIISGSLLEGDDAILDFNTELTQVGLITNQATVTVINETLAENVSVYYHITLDCGNLAVTPRPITLKTDSGEHVYDAQAFSLPTYRIVSELSLPEGHTLYVDASTSVTDTAVNIPNEFQSLRITLADGTDVTSNFDIGYELGLLTVTKRPLLLQTESANKVYDATPLSHPFVTPVNPADLLEGDTVEVLQSASCLNVGTYENTVEDIKIYSGSGDSAKDVTDNYQVSYQNGSLKIDKRPITLQGAGGEWVYDGNEHTATADPQMMEGSLVDGHIAQFAYHNSIRYADMSPIDNVFTATIMSGEQDVTDNYDITYVYDTLQVKPRPITLQSSAQKVYDAQPLTSDVPIILSELGLVDGDELTIVTDGLITNAGVCENHIISATVLNQGKDVTACYDFSFETGYLTVDKRQITLRSDAEKVYDGTPLVTTDYTDLGEAYFLVDGHYAVLETDGYLLDVGKETNRIIGYQIYDPDGNDVTDSYDVHTEEGILKVTLRHVTIQMESLQSVYNATPLTCTETRTVSELKLVGTDQFHVISSSSIIDVGVTENECFDFVIMDDNGEDHTDNYTVTLLSGTLEILPRPILIDIQDAEKIYDGTPLSQPAYLISEDTEHTLLVSGHYIASYDYPAYTDAGTYINFFSNLVIKALDERDVTENYDITFDEGVIQIDRRPILMLTGSAEKYYDGTYLQNQIFDIVWNGVGELQDPFVLDHVIRFEDSASIKNAGSVPNEFYGVYVYAPHADKDETANYEITFSWGTLTVLKREIIIDTYGDEKMYDGKELSNPGFDVSGMGLASNEMFVPILTTIIIDANRLDHNGLPIPVANVFIQYEIQSIDGTPLCADNYDITFHYGSLVIHRRKITVEITGSKTYDGEPMQNSALTATDLKTPYALLPGHHFDFSLKGIVIDPGVYGEDILQYLNILDRNDQNVTSNYDVALQVNVVVEKADIEISSSAEKYYDGTPLTSNQAQFNGFLYENHEILLETEGSQTEIGSSPNVILSVKIRDILTQIDVTDYYNIVTAEGTLTVKDPTIYIISKSAKKEYDGTPLVCHDYDLSGAPLPKDYKLILTYTGSQTEIGESENFFSYRILDADRNDVTDRMFVKCEFGILTVTAPKGTDIIGGTDGSYGDGYLTITMYSQLGGAYYVRDSFYGDYNGLGFDPAPRYTGALINPMMLTGWALKEQGFSGHLVKFEGGQYVTYHVTNGLAADTMTPTIVSGNRYTYEVVSPTDYSIANLPSELAAFEQEYRAFVYDHYLQIPDSTKEVLLRLAAEAGLDPNSPNIIAEVTAYIATAAEYDLEYGAYTYREDTVVEFLTEVKRGVCVHYASSAAMMFRALGIPARYVTGAVPTAVAGEWAEIKVIGHAWTEVYLDGIGWIYIDATGAGDLEELPPSEPTILPQENEIVLVPHEIKVTFDGKLHGPSGDQYTIVSGTLPEGYTITDVVFSDPQWKPGRDPKDPHKYAPYKSYITQCRILDETGYDVTDQFSLKFESAELDIIPCPLTIRTSSSSRVYNGHPLTANKNSDWWISEGILPDGFTVQVEIDGTITKVGTVPNSIKSVTILDENGNDVTDYFNIEKKPGDLTIKPVIV